MRCFLSLPTEQYLKKAWISPRSPFHGSMGSTTQKGVGNRLRLSGVGSSPGPRVLQSLVHPMALVRGIDAQYLISTWCHSHWQETNTYCWPVVRTCHADIMRLDWTNLGLVFEQKRQNKQKHRWTVVLYLGLAVCYWLLLMAKILHHLRRTLQIKTWDTATPCHLLLAGFQPSQIEIRSNQLTGKAYTTKWRADIKVLQTIEHRLGSVV